MFIAIDIGNSSINIGIFNKTDLYIKKIDTKPLRSTLAYKKILNSFIREKNIDKIPVGSIISSVVPSHTEIWIKSLKEITVAEPILVSYKIKTGLRFKIPHPEQLGSDRIANAVAAHEIYKCPTASVDVGTATTISVTGMNNDYIGGAILPGIELMNESLAEKTSTLYKISFNNTTDSALGIDTTGCIQSGILYGTAGAIEKIVKAIEKEAGFKLKVVLTGGYSCIIKKFLNRRYILRPNLTLEGLKILYMRNTYA